jgi:DNA mismatch endonuclease (patch repair protein)
VAKIGRNIERDAEQNRRLAEMGWMVIRLWESDVLADPGSAAQLVASMLQQSRTSEAEADPVR